MPRTLAAFLTVLLLAALAGADTMLLRDGRQMSGKVTKVGGKVRLETSYGTVEFAESEVAQIIYGTPAEPAATTSDEEPSSRPAVRAPQAVRWDPENVTIPEPMVFMLARQQELTAGDPGADMTAVQLKQWRIVVHEGKRKWRGQWLTRDDRRRHVTDFEKNLKDAAEQARQAKFTYGSSQADLNKKKKLEAQAQQLSYDAAGAWPDGLISDFLTGVLDLQWGKPKLAEARFRRCADAEPLIAAFHQGRGMALVASKQPLAALGEFSACLDLRNDSYEPLRLIEETLKEVPGAQVKDPSYGRAQDLLNLYEQPKYGYKTSGGTPWLMPGKGWQARDEGLFEPTYERIICKQALAIPITEDGAMLIDKSAIAGADLIYVQVAPDTVVLADPVRSGAGAAGKTDLPLAIIRANGVTLTPVEVDKPADLKLNQTVSIRAANIYTQMGTEIRTGQGQVSEVGDAGVTLDKGTLPGEGLAVAFDGEAFAGLLTGRTDPEAEDCGKCTFIKPADLTAWMTQAKKNLRAATPRRPYNAPVLKKEEEKKAVTGKSFLTYIFIGENVPKLAGK